MFTDTKHITLRLTVDTMQNLVTCIWNKVYKFKKKCSRNDSARKWLNNFDMVFHFREKKKEMWEKKLFGPFFSLKDFRDCPISSRTPQIQLEEHIHFICKHCYTTNHFTNQEIRSILFLHISTQVHFFLPSEITVLLSE